MSMIKGIHHVALRCSGPGEFEKVLGFYRDLLGLETVRTWGQGEKAGAMLGAGGDIVEIFASGRKGEGVGSIEHFAFETDDVDLCTETVRKAGYVITTEPKDVTIASVPAYPIRCSFCSGPLGESIEFFQIY